jgi:hypothetical protein
MLLHDCDQIPPLPLLCVVPCWRDIHVYPIVLKLNAALMQSEQLSCNIYSAHRTIVLWSTSIPIQ